MKYIMFETKSEHIIRHTPIIFPDHLSHDEVAKAIEPLISGVKPEVVSAGAIEIDVVSVSGASNTLGLKSNPKDYYTILNYEYRFGVQP